MRPHLPHPLRHRYRNHPWECMGPPIPRVLKLGLRKRLFFAFGAAIIASSLVVLLVTNFFAFGGQGWRQQIEGARSFMGGQLEKVWDDTKAREAFAQELSSQVGLNVSLLDAKGSQLSTIGGDCEYRKVYVVPVLRLKEKLGEARFCTSGQFTTDPWVFPVALLSACAMLWFVAGKFARRMSQPLSELARVADEIGQGNLSSRVRIRHGHGEAGILADAINQMAERIEEQVAAQKELLAAVSHELRTPLARLRLLTEIGRGAGTADSKLFDDVDEEVLELDSLVGDLLAKSRLDFASFTPKSLEAEAMAERALERAGLSLTLLSVEAHGLLFSGDATLIARALANLIENAKRHGGGLTQLRIVRRGDLVSFEAEDAGPGLSQGQESTMFEAFQQGSNTDRSGLGLGLALVKRIAEVHQGKAFARNLPQGGACVGIELPTSTN
jgi:two-component system, OmpR family, sensor kinase